MRVSAPGKVILFGEHAVVHGKKGVAASVDLNTELAMDDTATNDVHLILPGVKVDCKWPLELLEQLSQAHITVDIEIHTKLHDEITSQICHQHTEHAQKSAILVFWYLLVHLRQVSGKPLKTGFRIKVDSKLPIGAGLGSSASYSVCIAAALLVRFGLVSGDASMALTTAARETINKYAFMAEKLIHGNPSGIDNAVCAFGGALIFQKGSPVQPCSKFPELKFLLVNTNVPRQTSVQVANVANFVKKYPGVGQPILEAIHGVGNVFEELLNLSRQEMEERFETLIRVNHRLISSCGVSHPKLDLIASLADQQGFAAKLTGAGGGGCALVFLRTGSDKSRVEALKKDISKHEMTVYEVTLGCPGVQFVQ